jgi:fibronectin-binding autotransporter adhesin
MLQMRFPTLFCDALPSSRNVGTIARSWRVVVVVVTMAASASLQEIRAASTWDGGAANNNWSDGLNWSSNIAPVSSVNTQLEFAGATRLSPNANLADPILLNSLSFNSGAGGFQIGGSPLDFHTSDLSVAPFLNQNSSNNQTIQNAINFSNDTSFGGTASGQLTLDGALSGTGGLKKNNPNNTLLLSSGSLGFLQVNAGTVRLVNTALSLSATGSTGFSGNSSLFVESGATLNVVDGSNLSTNGTPQIHNNGQMLLGNGSVWINSAAGGNSEIRVGYAGGTSSLTVDNSSVITGALRLGHNFSGNQGHGSLMVYNGSTLVMATLVLDDTAGASITMDGGSTVQVNAINELQTGSTIRLGNGSRFIIGGSPSDYSFGGTFQDITGQVSTGSISKFGSETLTLSGASSGYSGTFDLVQGKVGVGNNAALGTGTLVVDGGSLFASGGDRTLSNPITLASDLNAVTVSGNVHNLNLAGPITGLGGLTVNAPGGTVTLSGTQANTYTGLTSVKAGTLALSKTGAGAPDVFAGSLSIGNAASPGAAGSAVVRVDTPTLQHAGGTDVTIYADGLLNLNSQVAAVKSLTMTGGELNCGGSSGGPDLQGDVTINASSVGSRITQTANSSFIFLHNASRTFTVSNGTALYDLDVMAGVRSGTLIKQGAGTMRLGGVNTNFLAVTANEGLIALAHDLALGNSNATFTLAGGTVVADGGDRTITNPVSVTASSAIGSSVDGTPRNFTFNAAASLATGAVLTVSNNATTTLSGSVSGAGSILKTGAGTLALSNAANTFIGGLTVNGGTVSAAADGSLGAASNVVAVNAGLVRFENDVTTGRTFYMSGGTLLPASGKTITYVGATVTGGTLGAGSHVLQNGTTLTGTRTTAGTALSQSGGTVAFNNFTLGGNSTFTQSAGATVNSTGEFISTPNSTMTLAGTMNTASGSMSGAVTIPSAGKLNQSGPDPLYLDGSRGITVNSGGQLNAAAGSTIELGGLLINNGTQTGALNINVGGLAKGTGVFGDVHVNDGGAFAPGTSPGAATIAGAYVQQNGGKLEIEIGGTTRGTQYDALNASAALTLDGVLAVQLVNGFTPSAGNAFDILDWGGLSGTFQSINLPALGAGLMWNATHLYTNGVLSVTLVGDYNGNGIVDAADYTVWRDTLGQSGTGLAADGNANKQIDSGDFDAWRNHFGESAGIGAAAAVPEPSTIALFAFGLLIVAGAGRSMRVQQ